MFLIIIKRAIFIKTDKLENDIMFEKQKGAAYGEYINNKKNTFIY